ncbi:unnamed protein product [Ectocarpus sp. CCAP 1310/34]|nr:unnamed protein product [Ectocarpus sp. CCAP 1310/34]
MVTSTNTHLALLALLLGTQQGECHRYRTHGGHHHHHGRRQFQLPTVVSSEIVDTGAFRPFRHVQPRGRPHVSSAGPLMDVFQDVMGEIKKVACEFSDTTTDARSPPYEVLETPDAATLIVDLPGCKKEDVDAQVSEDSGTKTLTITAVRKKPRHADGNARSPSSPPDTSGSTDGNSAASTTGVADAAAPHEAGKDKPESSLSSFSEESFKLSFQIGDDIDVSVIRGGLEDGVLTLVLPKLTPEPPAEPIDIPIDFTSSTRSNTGTGEAGRERQAAASIGRNEESIGDAGGDADTHISLA